jgi:hypothetical protein
MQCPSRSLLLFLIITSFCDMVWRVSMVYPADKDMGALLIPFYNQRVIFSSSSRHPCLIFIIQQFNKEHKAKKAPPPPIRPTPTKAGPL